MDEVGQILASFTNDILNQATRQTFLRTYARLYIRLWKLEKAGFIQSLVTPDGQNHFWTLTADCFERIVKPTLDPLSQNGFASENLEHDFLVNAVHLGHWLQQVPSGVNLFSEQQLRRIETEFYPKWVPRSKIHRPDGYTLTTNGTNRSLVAIEVELSQKSLDLYENIGRFYCEDTSVNDVLWIVKRPGQAQSIQRRIEIATESKSNIHSFALEEDARKLNWNSKIVHGKRKGHIIQNLFETTPESPLKYVSGFDYFDTRKSLTISKKKQILKTQNFVNRVGPLGLSLNSEREPQNENS